MLRNWYVLYLRFTRTYNYQQKHYVQHVAFHTACTYIMIHVLAIEKSSAAALSIRMSMNQPQSILILSCYEFKHSTTGK